MTPEGRHLVRATAQECLRAGSSWRRALLVDVGSTFTKVAVVDSDGAVVATGRSATTVTTDVTHGLSAALLSLPEQCVPPFDWALATSSAAGGLRIASVGLTRRLSGQAGVFAALGAGGRMVIDKAGYLTDEDLADIADATPHVVLLSGGIDGGQADCLVHNAGRLSALGNSTSVIIAGNDRAARAAAAAFGVSSTVTVVENVYPAPSVVRIDGVRAAVRDHFMKHIAQAKGLDGLSQLLRTGCEPTPLAVSRAVSVIAEDAGVDSLALVDLGGATTDVHSCGGEQRRIRKVDLTAPHVIRTVEGDLGMRWGAPGAAEMIPADGKEELRTHFGCDVEVEAEIRRANPGLLPASSRDRAVDDELACAAVATALERHCGHIVVRHQPWGDRHRVEGKDLRSCGIVFATGGVFRANNHVAARSVLRKAVARAARSSFGPKHPRLVVDAEYLVYAGGLVAGSSRDLAHKVLQPFTSISEESAL